MRIAFVLAVLPAFPATAAIQACYLDEMVAQAVTVVQIVDQEVGRPDQMGNCQLTGTVARSFRGHTTPGTRVQTTFACGPEIVDGVPVVTPGGTNYHDAEAVAQAGAVEIHAAADGEPAGYGWGLLLIDKPTDEPMFAFDALNENGGSC